jgi:hypothetical protein
LLARIVITGLVERSKLDLFNMAIIYLFLRHDSINEFSWRVLPSRECLVIHIEFKVSVEQGTYYTGILHIGQILPLETALALVLVTCPDPDHLNESSYYNLLLWGKSVKWSPGGRHWVKSRSVSLNNVLVKGFFLCFLKANACITCT